MHQATSWSLSCQASTPVSLVQSASMSLPWCVFSTQLAAAGSLRVEVQGSQAIITGQQSTPGMCHHMFAHTSSVADYGQALLCCADGRLLSTKGLPRGVFKTAHRLPAGADHNSLRAVYTQGVLRISMRKQM